MAAHRWHLTASICVSLALLAGPAPALAAQQRVPDEAALTEYAGALPGADGPRLPGPSSAGAAPAGVLPAPVELGLARLIPTRGDALRRLATDRSLGAPALAGGAAAGDSAAQSGSRARLVAPEPSMLSAVLDAMVAAPASAMLLAVLLVVGLLATAGTRPRGGAPG
jgi:hypothetical protein